MLAGFTEETVETSTGRGVSGGVGTLLSHLQKMGVCSDVSSNVLNKPGKSKH